MPRHVAQTIATDFKSSFLSCEKDQEIILRKLFIENRPHSDQLKRLLIIQEKTMKIKIFWICCIFRLKLF